MLNRNYEDLKRIYFQESNSEEEIKSSSGNVLSIDATEQRSKGSVKDNIPKPSKAADNMAMSAEYTQEKAYVFLGVILSIVFSIVPSLALIVTRQDLSIQGKNILYKTLNFELVVILAIACVKLIPIYGNYLFFALFLMNFISCIRCANAINKGIDYNYPVALNFLKDE